jgi:hypothetical protein
MNDMFIGNQHISTSEQSKKPTRKREIKHPIGVMNIVLRGKDENGMKNDVLVTMNRRRQAGKREGRPVVSFSCQQQANHTVSRPQLLYRA